MSTADSSTTETKQLWGIYFTDREYTREMGDPLRTVIEAPSKNTAEEIAKRYGFSEPWAHPITEEQARQMRATEPRIRIKSGSLSQALSTKSPAAAEIHAAIEVLHILGERLSAPTNPSLDELPTNRFERQSGVRIDPDVSEQTVRIRLVSEQLTSWRNELLEQRNTVSRHV